MKLHIGCGHDLKPGWLNVDCRKIQHDGILWNPDGYFLHFLCVDLQQFPWPWDDNSIDEIYCQHWLEHMPDPVRCVQEMRRVLKPGGKVTIIVPHVQGIDAFQPEHHHYFSAHWFMSLSGDERMSANRDCHWFSKERLSLQVKVVTLNPGLFFKLLGFWIPLYEWFFNRSYRMQLLWEMAGPVRPSQITYIGRKI
jgi:SAM-dependent methyltransferase